MGNDGGSIPKRRELVKSAARQPTATELKETALESLAHAWSMCPLSSQPLDPNNTVSDARGRLYNYEAVLQGLLPSSEPAAATEEASAEEEAFRATGIRTLKDVVRLRFALRSDERGREFRACPVTLKELGAATRAVYVVPCGHVFAEAAMREIAGAADDSNGHKKKPEEQEERRCLECSDPFEDRDVIPILATSEAEATRLAARMDELKAKGLTHSLKKGKSDKKKRKADEASNGEKENTAGKKKEKKSKDNKGIDSRINNPMTASLTAKVLAEQEERNKRRKLGEGLKREAVR